MAYKVVGSHLDVVVRLVGKIHEVHHQNINFLG